MKSNRLFAALAVVSVCGSAVLAFREHRQGLAIERLRHEIAARPVEQPAIAPPASVPRAPSPAVAVTPAPPAPVEAAGSAESPIEAAPAIEPEEALARFDALFVEETTDTRWAQERSHALSTRVAAVLPDTSSLRSVECHTALCRVETVHESPESINTFAEGAFKNFDTKLTTGASFTTAEGQDERGRIVLVTYLAREGEPLPSLEAL